MKIIEPSFSLELMQGRFERRLDAQIDRAATMYMQYSYKMAAPLFAGLGISLSFQQWQTIQPKNHFLDLTTIEAKAESLKVLESALESKYREEEFHKRTRSFHGFARLPSELRLSICWGGFRVRHQCREYAFKTHRQTRVHCVYVLFPKSMSDEGLVAHRLVDPEFHTTASMEHIMAAILRGNLRFISNQPVHPTLHACHESRNLYLAKTGGSFAFETYLNFDRDIIYLADFAGTSKIFQEFLNCEEAKRIQTIMLPNPILCALPLQVDGDLDAKWELLRTSLPAWRETLVLFGDERETADIWHDTERGFTRLSSRQQRKKAEIGYARHFVNNNLKVIESWSERWSIDFTPITYRYVVLKSKYEAENEVPSLDTLQI